MLILFDHSTPAPLRAFLRDHTIVEAIERGWHRLSNGDLLNAGEAEGFDVLIAADKNIRYQQNLSTRRIAIVELSTPRWPVLRQHCGPGCFGAEVRYARWLHRSGHSA